MGWRSGDLKLVEGLNVSHPYRDSFPGVQRSKYGTDHTPPSSFEVKEGVELDLYFPSGPSWPVIRWTVPLPYVRLCTTVSYLIVSRVFMIISMWLLYKKLPNELKFRENPCCGSRTELSGVNKISSRTSHTSWPMPMKFRHRISTQYGSPVVGFMKIYTVEGILHPRP